MSWNWNRFILAFCAGFLLVQAAGCLILRAQEGMILRGVLESASSDGTPYFKIGEAFIITMPRDSALVPGIRALEGKKVIISIQGVD